LQPDDQPAPEELIIRKQIDGTSQAFDADDPAPA
jgi:hypothetical protein